jgi:hypothetical protein
VAAVLLIARAPQPARCLQRGRLDPRVAFRAAQTARALAFRALTRAGTSRILELPISAALNRSVPAFLERWYGRAPWPYQTKRALRLARIAHVRWLRPSYSSADDMMALARQIANRGVPILNLLFHSSEAIVGGSPYNRTQGELDGFFDRLGRALAFMTEDLGAEPMTFEEYHATVAGASPARATA